MRTIKFKILGTTDVKPYKCCLGACARLLIKTKNSYQARINANRLCLVNINFLYEGGPVAEHNLQHNCRQFSGPSYKYELCSWNRKIIKYNVLFFFKYNLIVKKNTNSSVYTI